MANASSCNAVHTEIHLNMRHEEVAQLVREGRFALRVATY
jgi:hypothetical protein